MPAIGLSTIKLNVSEKQGSKGILFLVLVWFAFLLPSVAWGAFPFIIGHTSLSELAIISMPFVYAMYPKHKTSIFDAKYSVLRKTILLFFFLSIIVNLFQYLIYGGSIEAYFRINRPLIPLYVSLALIYLRPRIKPKLLLANLFLCLLVSFLISLFFFFTEIEFTPFIKTELDEEVFQIMRKGRLMNVNSGFAYLALGCLVGLGTYRWRLRPAWLSRTIFACCLLSITIAFLGFNRTFIFIAVFFSLYATIRFFSLRTNIIICISVVFAISVSVYAYYANNTVKEQFDKRIILPFQSREAMLDSVYYDNRDILFMDYWEAGKKFFPIGVPPNVAITERYEKGQLVALNITDISLMTIFLRLGVLPLIAYFFIGILFYRYLSKKFILNEKNWSNFIYFSLLHSFPFIVLGSLNNDLLARHYSVIFIGLLFMAKDFK